MYSVANVLITFSFSESDNELLFSYIPAFPPAKGISIKPHFMVIKQANPSISS